MFSLLYPPLTECQIQAVATSRVVCRLFNKTLSSAEFI